MTTEAIIKTVLIIVHIVFATMWFGPTLGIGKNLKTSLAAGREAFGAALADFDYRGKLSAIGGMGALVTGLVLMFYSFGGFKAAPIPFHMALGFAILAIVNSFAFGKYFKVLRAAHERFDDASKETARATFKRVAMHAGISHTLWLASLAMMIIARFRGA